MIPRRVIIFTVLLVVFWLVTMVVAINKGVYNTPTVVDKATPTVAPVPNQTTFTVIKAAYHKAPVRAAAPAQATTLSATPTSNTASQDTITVILRNGAGAPVTGTVCEVISYDWGLQRGEANHVIARGETDANGSVTFDDTIWPPNGYKFHFTPTNHTGPAGTTFDSTNEDHYQQWPGADLKSQSNVGQHETAWFVLFNDGIVYTDVSDGQGKPQKGGVAVGGLQQPRVTIMPSDKYFATVRSQTATAYASNGGFETAIARNIATATAQAGAGSSSQAGQQLPDSSLQNVPTEAPTPLPGMVAAPLSVTPLANITSVPAPTGQTTTVTGTSSATVIGQGQSVIASASGTSSANLTPTEIAPTTSSAGGANGATTGNSTPVSSSSPATTSAITSTTSVLPAATNTSTRQTQQPLDGVTLFYTTLLAIIAILAVGWFLRNQNKVNNWLGVETGSKKVKVKTPRRPKAESGRIKPGKSDQNNG